MDDLQETFKTATIVVKKRDGDLNLSVNGEPVHISSLSRAMDQRDDAIDPVTQALYSAWSSTIGYNSARVAQEVQYSPRQSSSLGLSL